MPKTPSAGFVGSCTSPTTAGAKQVEDIHKEAKRLAEIKKEEAGGSAYKAVGLDKIFGPEKTADGAAEGAVVGEVQEPTKPAEGVLGNQPPKA